MFFLRLTIRWKCYFQFLPFQMTIVKNLMEKPSIISSVLKLYYLRNIFDLEIVETEMIALLFIFF